MVESLEGVTANPVPLKITYQFYSDAVSGRPNPRLETVSPKTGKRRTLCKRSPRFLWFDGKAEEAANFYVSIFKNSRIVSQTRYGDGAPGPKGTVMSVTFQLDGQEFFARNGSPQFAFTPAISLFVNCETQREVDELWEKLSEGGAQERCGWLKTSMVCRGKLFPLF